VFSDRPFRERHCLQANPAPAPPANRIFADSQFSGDLGIALPCAAARIIRPRLARCWEVLYHRSISSRSLRSGSFPINSAGWSHFCISSSLSFSSCSSSSLTELFQPLCTGYKAALAFSLHTPPSRWFVSTLRGQSQVESGVMVTTERGDQSVSVSSVKRSSL